MDGSNDKDKNIRECQWTIAWVTVIVSRVYMFNQNWHVGLTQAAMREKQI